MRRREQTRGFKLKLIHRLLILLAVFIGALWYFSGHYLTIRTFQNITGTTEMAEATLPHLTLVSQDQEMNQLYGYTANLDWALNRETITPLSSDQTFTVKIFENATVVRKLKYELYDVASGKLLEENTIAALTEDEFPDCKSVKIKLKSELARGTEYSVKLTLVTSDSKRIYFYTRVKVYANGYLSQKLSYVTWFRNSLINKQNQLQIEKNLETKPNADRTNFAHVDINSNWTMASWGNMQPKVVAELPPTITDFYEEYASVVLNYIVEVNTDGMVEYMQVRETFRLLYTTIRTYLYTYERDTETIFDVDNTYLLSNDFRLGITNDTQMEILTTSSYKYTAMVHNGELWSYSSADNEMTRVFSFKDSPKEPVINLAAEDHNIKLLRQDAAGNIDFVVYGYMSRGEYEGRVGISFYHYDQATNQLSELAHIPVNTTYELLKGELTDLLYRNNLEVIYIAMYDTVYSYNITTKKLTEIAKDVPEGHFAYLTAAKKIIWQDKSDDAASDKLVIMNLDNGERSEWKAKPGEVICLLGKIDSNAIVGYAKQADLARNQDGSKIIPMYKVEIIDADGKSLKSYEQSGVYITDVSVNDNVILLERVKKREGSGYVSIDSDGISNRVPAVVGAVSVISRNSDVNKTEYYISFPTSINMKNIIPSQRDTSFTLLSTDRTVRILPDEESTVFYRTYSFGRVVRRTAKLSDAIAFADSSDSLGAVIDNKGRLIWERGVKATRSSISGITIEKADKLTSLQACLKMLFKHEGYDVDTSAIDFNNTTVTQCLQNYIKVTGLELKGVTGEQMLYYVYKKRPVIAITGQDTAVLIVGYDANSIEYIDPLSGKSVKIQKEFAANLFEDSGYTFYCYIK